MLKRMIKGNFFTWSLFLEEQVAFELLTFIIKVVFFKSIKQNLCSFFHLLHQQQGRVQLSGLLLGKLCSETQ